jgi:hypothetical protein
MNTSNLIKLIAVTLFPLPLMALHAQMRSSTYTGRAGGNWSNPANWTPKVVPNNTGTATFDVTDPVSLPGVTADIDITVNTFTMQNDFSGISGADHNFTSGSSSIGVASAGQPFGGGVIFVNPVHKSVVWNLGNLADFSGTTLGGGNYVIDTVGSDPGVTGTIQWNGAKVVSNGGDIQFAGANTLYKDELGDDALAGLAHNLPSGILDMEVGRNFTTAGAFLNEGEVHVFSMFTGTPTDPADHGFSSLTTFTVTGDLTMLGTDQEGYIDMISKGKGKDARVEVTGTITDYDPAKKTLKGGQYELTAGEGGACTVQVLGAPLAINEVDSFMSLIGPNTTFLDSTGADALRNLTTDNGYFRIGDRDFTTAGSFTSAGVLSIRGNSHFNVTGDLTISGGIFAASEQTGYNFEGALNNFAGSTPYGDSVTNVTGKFVLGRDGAVRFDIAPTKNIAALHVTREASLAGTLLVFVVDEADAINGNGRTLLTAGDITGAFSNVKNGGRVLAYAEDGVTLGHFGGVIAGSYKASYAGTALSISDFQPHASMLNISTRLKVETGPANAGIAGFIVDGIDPKKVLIRAIAPSLASKGVSDCLVDPTLELRDSTGAVVQKNDNWQDTQKNDITATGIAPTDTHESAIVATLDPGSYTAMMQGAGSGTGVGLVEIYDLDKLPAGSQFANLSTRGRVEAGNDVMIGGLIVGSDAPAHIVVRALGPSLAAKGVVSPLLDPTLEVHDASGAVVASNDDWQSGSNANATRTAGLAPSDSRESAIEVSLSAGKYTAIVRSKNSTQGTALVEFYKLN